MRTNKLLKLVLMFIAILLILCISNNVKAANKFWVEHVPGQNPTDCTQQQGNPVYFFCRNEQTPWNWYTHDPSKFCIPKSRDVFKEREKIDLDPSISFGLYTLQQKGWSLKDNLELVQNLIWGSVKYPGNTCEGGNASLYDSSEDVIRRADQYGMFYHDLLGGGDLKIEVDKESIENAKVHINQPEKTAIIGPYLLKLENQASEEAMQNLWDELAGKNKEAYGDWLPPFAEYEMEIDGSGEKKIFLDEKGEEVKFPKFNEKFYIKFDLDKEAEKVHAKIKIKYIKKATGVAYGYISDEDETRIHAYAVTDTWYSAPAEQGSAAAEEALSMVGTIGYVGNLGGEFLPWTSPVKLVHGGGEGSNTVHKVGSDVLTYDFSDFWNKMKPYRVEGSGDVDDCWYKASGYQPKGTINVYDETGNNPEGYDYLAITDSVSGDGDTTDGTDAIALVNWATKEKPKYIVTYDGKFTEDGIFDSSGSADSFYEKKTYIEDKSEEVDVGEPYQDEDGEWQQDTETNYYYEIDGTRYEEYSDAEAEANKWENIGECRKITIKQCFKKVEFFFSPTEEGKLQPQVVIPEINVTVTPAEIEIDLKEKNVTIIIGGFTWMNNPENKGVPSSRYNAGSDEIYAGMEVELFRVEEGSNNEGGTSMGTVLTGKEGCYRFVKLKPLYKYYVRFKYNGQLYQANPNQNNIAWDGGYSNADEIDRTEFNRQFQTIDSTPANYGGKRAYPYKQRITKDNANTFEKIWGGDKGDITGSFRKVATDTSGTVITKNDGDIDKRGSDDGSYDNGAFNAVSGQVAQYIKDCMIYAKTDTYPLEDQFVVADLKNPPEGKKTENIGPLKFDYLYTKGSDQARNVDFGVYRRKTSEVRIQKDLYSARIISNGKEHTYIYNKRDPGTLTTPEGTWEIPMREMYTKQIRPSSYYYEGDKEIKDLQVYVTYRIHVGNAGMVPVTINEIVDYYDNDQYKFQWANTDPKAKVKGMETRGEDLSTTGNSMGSGFKSKLYLIDKITLAPGTLSKPIYVTFKVNTIDDNNRRLKIDIVNYNIVEIDGYSTEEGIVDTFSNPGNLEQGDVNEQGDIINKVAFEPDTDTAPGLTLTLSSDDRKISGNVFEDLRDTDVYGAIIGNGRRGDEEKAISGVKVELIELMQNVDDEEGLHQTGYRGERTALKRTAENPEKEPKVEPFITTSGNDGTYSFMGVPPGDFYVKFTYGDKVVCNGKVYNGQDFKSTTYQRDMSQIGTYDIPAYSPSASGTKQDNPTYTDLESLYYYNITEADNHPSNSDAKDIWSKREEINTYSKGSDGKNLLNHRAEELKRNSDPSVDWHGKTTKDMIAQTGVIDMEVEYDGLGRHMENQNEDEYNESIRVYHIDNVNLGLVERPRAQLKLNKEIVNLKIALSNGNVIFNTNQSINNLYFAQHQGHSVKYENTNNITKKLLTSFRIGDNSETSPELIQAYMDEELIAGANIQATYMMTVENVGEIDYKDPKFYYTGEVEDRTKENISKTSANEVIDYVSNLIEYDARLQASDDLWKVKNTNQLVKSSTLNNKNEIIVTGNTEEDLVNRKWLNRLVTYNRLITTESLKEEDLVPSLASDRGTSSKSTTLVLTKTLANTSGDDEFIYNNLSEIISTSNEQGRRMQFSISGNQEMADQSIKTNNADQDAKTSIKVIKPSEIDADSAQKIVILPPTGENKNYVPIIVTLISALAIVALGIVAVRKILGIK